MRLLRVRDTHMHYAERCTCIGLCCSDCVSLACDYGCACEVLRLISIKKKARVDMNCASPPEAQNQKMRV